MQNIEIRDKIYALMKKHPQANQEINAESDILLDTGLDSVSVMDIVMEIEDEFDAVIPIEKLSNVRTVGDFEVVITDILSAKS